MILLIHHSFTRILPYKDVNLKTSRLPLSPLQAQKQVYFLNQANEKKHLNFELYFSFFILISVPVHFSLHKSFPQYAQIQHTSHIYIFFKELGIYIGRELFIRSFQLWETPPDLIHLSISQFLSFLLFPHYLINE